MNDLKTACDAAKGDIAVPESIALDVIDMLGNDVDRFIELT